MLAPALNTPVAHWLSDLRKARFDAQRRLASRSARWRRPALDARGQVGDSDPVQAVEDALRTFPAQEVVFVDRPASAPRRSRRCAAASTARCACCDAERDDRRRARARRPA